MREGAAVKTGYVARQRYERERAARLRAEKLLEERSLELYEAARTKERFLRNINHEFRTPMNGIIGPAQLLQAENIPEAVRGWGDMIERSARELLEFLETAIEMARVNGTCSEQEADVPDYTPLILIVDDNSVNRMVAKAAVEAIGMRSAQAENGAEALNLLAEQSPDGILMDLQMPVMSGQEAIKAIRSSGEAWSRTPIIILTANADPDGPQLAQAMGADGYMTKPIAVRHLQDRLRELTKVKVSLRDCLA
ncbi:hybrid sensor histidine kinase/response regulator [Parvularcula lutaonensis]|uniref:histidine kinase n=1 Tax=Parvularcula lutaonensis TaxID=491923 RepID=A0ABV7MCV9_9PROT|nr:response regulator [Parvularcula lutaonensis]GGY51142.1 hypothetical protein GCM10007148_20010 [Parvularcula lutaonensis]